MAELKIDYRYGERWVAEESHWVMSVDVTVYGYTNVRCLLVVGSNIPDPMVRLNVERSDQLYATIRCDDPNVRMAAYDALRVSTVTLVECLEYSLNFIKTYGVILEAEATGGMDYITATDGELTFIRHYLASSTATFIVKRGEEVGSVVVDITTGEEVWVIPMEKHTFKRGYFVSLNNTMSKQRNFIGDVEYALLNQ